MVNSQETLRLVYHDAADGPRILLFGSIDVELAPLIAYFRQLSDADGRRRLDQQAFVRSEKGVELHVERLAPTRSWAERLMSPPGLTRVRSHPLSFAWRLSSEDGEDLADLIQAVAESDEPCHQYLSRTLSDDARVVVSKGEYSDATFAI